MSVDRAIMSEVVDYGKVKGELRLPEGRFKGGDRALLVATYIEKGRGPGAKSRPR